MSILHHLDDATILRYASGDLDEAFMIVVATHLAMCGGCRRAVQVAEEIGGELIEHIEPVDMPLETFYQLERKLDGEAGPARPDPGEPGAVFGESVPLPLRSKISNDIDELDWKFVAPGIARYRILEPDGDHGALYMLRIAPGKAVPEHGHGGAEMTLVLSGAYRDVIGRFGPGDIADLDEHVEHQPVVEAEAPCICLVATEAPTRFKGLFSRMLQPLTGI